MMIKTDCDLFFEGTRVAKIISFTFETPWASGQVKFIDAAFHQKLINITTYVMYDVEVEARELPEAEEDALLEAKLAELNLVWEDTALQKDGKWAIETTDGDRRPIFAVRFETDGFIDFRL